MKNRIYLLLLVIWCSCSDSDKGSITTGHEGDGLPAFSMLLADSITHLNTGNITGNKPLAFFYFGPYCPYSRAQMEEIVDHMGLLKDIHFYVLTYAPYKQMQEFYNYYHLGKYTNITVGIDNTKYFQQYFKLEGVPFMAVYGRDRKLKHAFIGEVQAKRISEFIKE